MTHNAARQGKKRKQAWGRGRHAETWAAWWLRARGYRILARNYRTSVGEIDIIARRAATICIVEVKRRATRAGALEAIRPRNRQRIIAATRIWLAENPPAQTDSLRFDAILVVPGCLPEHVICIFEAASLF